jgi:uncharacterized protein
MHDFDFAGHTMRALPDAALYWPARRALLVADLHLEKASWFAARGQMLPPYDSAATLVRLAAVTAVCDPTEIWALGDSFHDADGPERLDGDAVAQLNAITHGRRLVWIAGNHDACAALPGERHEEAEVDGVILRHEAEADEARPEISGHFHPKVTVATSGRAVSRRCFLQCGNHLILPAFGALTGGLRTDDPALAELVGDGAEALVATSDRLLRFPVVASQRPQAA